jgi:hypothetical protein
MNSTIKSSTKRNSNKQKKKKTDNVQVHLSTPIKQPKSTNKAAQKPATINHNDQKINSHSSLSQIDVHFAVIESDFTALNQVLIPQSRSLYSQADLFSEFNLLRCSFRLWKANWPKSRDFHRVQLYFHNWRHSFQFNVLQTDRKNKLLRDSWRNWRRKLFIGQKMLQIQRKFEQTTENQLISAKFNHWLHSASAIRREIHYFQQKLRSKQLKSAISSWKSHKSLLSRSRNRPQIVDNYLNSIVKRAVLRDWLNFTANSIEKQTIVLQIARFQRKSALNYWVLCTNRARNQRENRGVALVFNRKAVLQRYFTAFLLLYLGQSYQSHRNRISLHYSVQFWQFWASKAVQRRSNHQNLLLFRCDSAAKLRKFYFSEWKLALSLRKKWKFQGELADYYYSQRYSSNLLRLHFKLWRNRAENAVKLAKQRRAELKPWFLRWQAHFSQQRRSNFLYSLYIEWLDGRFRAILGRFLGFWHRKTVEIRQKRRNFVILRKVWAIWRRNCRDQRKNIATLYWQRKVLRQTVQKWQFSMGSSGVYGAQSNFSYDYGRSSVDKGPKSAVQRETDALLGSLLRYSEFSRRTDQNSMVFNSSARSGNNSFNFSMENVIDLLPQLSNFNPALNNSVDNIADLQSLLHISRP